MSITSNELNEIFSNNFNVPIPTEPSSKEGKRFLKDYDIASRKRKLEDDIEINEKQKGFQKIVDEWTRSEMSVESQEQPPLWYQREKEEQTRNFNLLLKGVNQLQRNTETLQRSMATMQSSMVTMQTSVDTLTGKVNRIDIRSVRMENKELRRAGYPIMEVPFLEGNNPDSELPRITCTQDIDRLSKDECIRYLNGYGISFNANETIALKKKLANAVGLVLDFDKDYSFSGFSNL
ncbi:cell surface glycoprotein [Schizosaccharomyces cryophilus OY26]|uniref:Cell surface glycoprotein n=1 Tax=Schizosaccharomyces cryophilus (strain OY26 / ATCC MYA-4695 / CBS 11777 / NBRC 106824 / NRRL Y48691) TaxID=653667 RepID=S9VT68_SCHCR|nr:cell surface glycoprotein [Schizosaccharomyces cryophilus OY26]EPY51068.1 cell surface glycoprotein [Schizosaccharomyces cryophilus OY26]